jgi:hypothetical protein
MMNNRKEKYVELKQMQRRREVTEKVGSTCECGTSYITYSREGRSENISDMCLLNQRHTSEICKVRC